MISEKLKLLAINVKDKGYFISNADKYSNIVEALYFDGKKGEKTFDPHWYKIEKLPKRIYKLVQQSTINHRFILKDSSMTNDKIPLEFERESVAYYSKSDYMWIWKDEFKHLESLYMEVWVEVEPIEEDLEFEIEVVAEIKDISPPKKFSFPVWGQWKHEGERSVTEDRVQYSILDKIIFPNILLHERHCRLNSKEVYEIIRYYVLENINTSVAKVTSDYNFCFDVAKLVSLTEEIEQKIEQLTMKSKSYKPPRYHTRFIKNREISIFKMAPKGEKNYNETKGYWIVPDIEGNNLEDLIQNIKKLLSEIIEFINEPVEECKTCKGIGVLGVEKYIPKKER